MLGAITVSSVISDLGDLGEWLWSIFYTLINTIQSNAFLLFVVLFGLTSSAVILAIQIVRKFGLIRGRRRGRR